MCLPNEDQTWVTVRKGNGEATGQGPAVKVKSGEQVRFSTGTSLQNTCSGALLRPTALTSGRSVRDKRLR